MAYNKFKKLEILRRELGIKDIMRKWLPQEIKSYTTISSLLKESLDEASYESLTTEKAKSESIISPIIKELRRKNPAKFSFFSGFEFNVDASKNLKGYCDYVLSADTERGEITSPVFALVEAKDGEIDKGYAQCGAEMYAAQIFNEREGNPKKNIYGCVTNATSIQIIFRLLLQNRIGFWAFCNGF
ncbi:MAG: hypothetical protein EAZ97_13745 [Bacteroidetes bacterium]|nr:MAG: hypothetical protein EAZ97_13745 [Bacteroidota bacterium]